MIYFLIPIYNEASNIPTLYSNFDQLNLEEEVFFVFSDDGSTDDSRLKINEFFRDSNFIILGDGSNQGPGYAFNSGFNWILVQPKTSQELIITIEADSTGDYSLIPEMIAIEKLGYNLILASVYAQGGGFDKTKWFRKVISFFANMLFRLFFNLKVQTLSSFYRCYSRDLIEKIEQKYPKEIIIEKGFISMLEVLLKSVEADAKIVELPMKLNSGARLGKSKMKITKTTVAYLKFLIRYKFR